MSGRRRRRDDEDIGRNLRSTRRARFDFGESAEERIGTTEDYYPGNQGQSLAGVQADKLRREKQLLSGIIDPHGSIPAAEKKSWAGMQYNGVIDLLGQICTSQPMDRSEYWVKSTGNVKENSPLDSKFERHPDDYCKWYRKPRTSALNEGEQRVRKNLEMIMKFMEKEELLTYKTRATIARRLKLANQLTVLRRFTDLRNPELTTPLRLDEDIDNANIADPNLQIAWALYRVWIRLLNYGSHSIGEEEFSHKQLLEVLKIAINRYYSEVARDVSITDPKDDPSFGIKQMLDSAESSLEQFSNEFENSIQEYNDLNGTDLTIADLLEGSTPHLANLLINEALSRSFREDYMIEQRMEFITDLLIVAEDYQNRVNQHIDGILMDRETVLSDEWWHTHRFLQENDREVNSYGAENIGWSNLPLSLKSINTDAQSARILQRIEEVNSLRRNNNLLRDWSRRGTIRQLFFTFDTRVGGDRESYRDLMDEFRNRMRHLAGIDQTNIDINSPSRKENIFAGLFPVHPIGMHIVEGGCTICYQPFQSNELLASLRCEGKHTFHQECLQYYWDNSAFKRNHCPMWDSPVYYTPNVYDVPQNGDEADLENHELATIPLGTNWMDTRGQDIRVVGVEMDHLRNARRRWNKERMMEFLEKELGDKSFGYASGPEKFELRNNVRRG